MTPTCALRTGGTSPETSTGEQTEVANVKKEKKGEKKRKGKSVT
jgi:hypothetical protein